MFLLVNQLNINYKDNVEISLLIQCYESINEHLAQLVVPNKLVATNNKENYSNDWWIKLFVNIHVEGKMFRFHLFEKKEKVLKKPFLLVFTIEWNHFSISISYGCESSSIPSLFIGFITRQTKQQYFSLKIVISNCIYTPHPLAVTPELIDENKYHRHATLNVLNVP